MAKHLISQNIISITELRRNLTAVFRRLPKRREPTVIQSNGAPIAIILSLEEYKRLTARRRAQAAFYDFSRNLGRDVEKLGLTEEELMADLEITKRKVFAEQYGRPA
ncbi:MAG: type II toxin-antitoxin system Phd/YefM family antitoxin [Chloroflexi bacterium]|nr:type II toxin-antitoxin system Phd/YefM family antitoxin [Chloroflexota bacterium]MBI5713170.1 type II toxin-antitoxin system Phd/YefM family antitoxin [Chloroflexota bacterium]